jgi:hypothetical protein
MLGSRTGRRQHSYESSLSADGSRRSEETVKDASTLLPGRPLPGSAVKREKLYQGTGSSVTRHNKRGMRASNESLSFKVKFGVCYKTRHNTDVGYLEEKYIRKLE